jgi:RNA polymerase sigma-70 factor (ECF subfamily)
LRGSGGIREVKDNDRGDGELSRHEPLSRGRVQYAELTDEELMFRVQEGDNRAFDILVVRYKNRLYSYLFRLLGDAVEAEEFAQEAFVKAYIHAEKYRTLARFSTWLYTIATNLVRNRMRNLKRRPAMVSLWAEDSNGESGRWMELKDDASRPDQDAEQSDLKGIIQDAIEKIPPKYRPPFVLREIDKLSYEEIAATTGLKLGTVRSRINRGRKYFRKAIAPHLGEDYRPKGNGS